MVAKIAAPPKIILRRDTQLDLSPEWSERPDSASFVCVGMFIALPQLRLASSGSYAHISTEFRRKGVIDGRSNTFLQSSCEYRAAFQLFGADTGLMCRLLRLSDSSNRECSE
jgi:hypothetical protein